MSESKTYTRPQHTGDLVHPDFDYINTEETDFLKIHSSELLHKVGAKPLVLVLDDNAPVVESLVLFLQQIGFDAIGEVDVNAATAKFGRYTEHWQLIIIDDCLHGVSGSELLKRFSQQAPQAKFILTSGYYADDLSMPSLGKTGAHFLSKPFSLRHLAEVIEQIGVVPPHHTLPCSLAM